MENMENKVNSKMPKKVPPKIKVEATSQVATRYKTLKTHTAVVKYKLAVKEAQVFINEQTRGNELVKELTTAVFTAKQNYEVNEKIRAEKETVANEKVNQYTKDLEQVNTIISALEAEGNEDVKNSKAYKAASKLQRRKESQINLVQGWNNIRNDKSKAELEKLNKLEKDQAAALELEEEATKNLEIINEIVAEEEKEYNALKQRSKERVEKAQEQRRILANQKENEIENTIDTAAEEVLESQDFEELSKDNNESAKEASEIFEKSEANTESNEITEEKNTSPSAPNAENTKEEKSKETDKSKVPTVVGGIGLIGAGASVALLIGGIVNPIVLIILAVSALVAGASFGYALQGSGKPVTSKDKAKNKDKSKDNSKDKEKSAEKEATAELENTNEKEEVLESQVMTLEEEEALEKQQIEKNITDLEHLDEIEFEVSDSYLISKKKVLKAANKDISAKFNDKEFDKKSKQVVSELDSKVAEYYEIANDFNSQVNSAKNNEDLKLSADKKALSLQPQNINENLNLKQIKKYLKNIDIEAINEANQEKYNAVMQSYEAKEVITDSYDKICDLATKLVDKNNEKYGDKTEAIENYKSARQDINELTKENKLEKISLIQKNIDNYNKIEYNKQLINSTKDKKEKEELYNSTISIFNEITNNNNQISEIEDSESEIYYNEMQMNNAIKNITNNLIEDYKNSLEVEVNKEEETKETIEEVKEESIPVVEETKEVKETEEKSIEDYTEEELLNLSDEELAKLNEGRQP